MKNLISLTELNKTEISQILEVAQQMRRIVTANYKRGPQLIGSVVAGVWPKPCLSSTAFSLAASYLSGTPCPFYNVDDIMSCCKMLENMGANTIVVSCENDNLAKTFASSSTKNVINGGSGQYGHVKIRFAPGEEEGLTFTVSVVGGTVPKNFYPAVEKGLQDAMQKIINDSDGGMICIII